MLLLQNIVNFNIFMISHFKKIFYKDKTFTNPVLGRCNCESFEKTYLEFLHFQLTLCPFPETLITSAPSATPGFHPAAISSSISDFTRASRWPSSGTTSSQRWSRMLSVSSGVLVGRDHRIGLVGNANCHIV